MLPPQSNGLIDDGWTLDVEICASATFDRKVSVTLNGMLDTGASLLVVDQRLKDKLAEKSVIDPDDPDDDQPVNGSTQSVWMVAFRCTDKSGASFQGYTPLCFLPLRQMGFKADALVGRTCLAFTKFTYDGRNDDVTF